jgi:hypothetical protein
MAPTYTYIEKHANDVDELVQEIKQVHLGPAASRALIMRGEDSAEHLPTAGIFRPGGFRTRVRHPDGIPAATAGTHVHRHSQSVARHVARAASRRADTLARLDKKPIGAAFFATEKPAQHDAAVWVVWGFDVTNGALTLDPFSIKTVEKISPVVVTPRLEVQSGSFTAHPDGRDFRESLQPSDCVLKVIIPAARRWNIRVQLEFLGINRASIFPDLDGLGAWLRWRATGLP